MFCPDVLFKTFFEFLRLPTQLYIVRLRSMNNDGRYKPSFLWGGWSVIRQQLPGSYFVIDIHLNYKHNISISTIAIYMHKIIINYLGCHDAPSNDRELALHSLQFQKQYEIY